MKLIITGATGFIGRNLAERLHEAGLDIIATGRSMQIGRALVQAGLEFKPADITEFSQVDEVFCEADCVIHCAARTGDWGLYKEFFQTNVLGTRNVIRACKQSNIRKLIFISTPSVYFNGRDRYLILENDPLPKKQFSYGKTKLICEKELLAETGEGFWVIIFRPRAVYGKYDQTIVPRILEMAEQEYLPLLDGGRALVDLTYIGNFIQAVQCALSAPDTAWNEIYNISNGQPITVRSWFSQVLDIFDRPFNPKDIPLPLAYTKALALEAISRLPLGNKRPPLTRFSVGYMGKTMTMSIDKARRLIGYQPKFTNQEGFQKYRRWYDRRKES